MADNSKSLWVAPAYKEQPNHLYLFNRKPILATKISPIFSVAKENNIYFSQHNYIQIKKDFWKLFDGMEFPVEVELVETTDENPAFFVQKRTDKTGFNNTFISTYLSKITVWLGKTEYEVNSNGIFRLPTWVFPDLEPNKIIKVNILVKNEK